MKAWIRLLVVPVWMACVAVSAHESEPRPFGRVSPSSALRDESALIPGIDPAELARLSMTSDQRRKVQEIERTLRRTQWRLTGEIRELRWKQQDALASAEADSGSLLRLHDMAAARRREYFVAALEARKQLEAVLTTEQREQVMQRWRPDAQDARRDEKGSSEPRPK